MTWALLVLDQTSAAETARFGLLSRLDWFLSEVDVVDRSWTILKVPSRRDCIRLQPLFVLLRLAGLVLVQERPLLAHITGYFLL